MTPCESTVTFHINAGGVVKVPSVQRSFPTQKNVVAVSRWQRTELIVSGAFVNTRRRLKTVFVCV